VWLAVEPTPDLAAVRALTCGPVKLAGVYGAERTLKVSEVYWVSAQPLRFEAISGCNLAWLILASGPQTSTARPASRPCSTRGEVLSRGLHWQAPGP